MHNDLSNKNNINLIAFWLQSSHLKKTPHEIKGEISFEGIINIMKCSCKAGLSGKCKHVVAVLLHLHTTDTRSLELVPCTDMKCLWNTPHAKALEDYNPTTLRDHKCFVNAFDKEYKTNINEEGEAFIQNLLFNCNMDSALTKHMLGRHEIIIPDVKNNNLVIDSNKLQALLENLPSESMKNLKEIVFEEEMKTCCKPFFKQLSRDTRSICVETQSSRRKWLESRQFRITGSRCYSILTYCNNKRPQWEQKSLK